MRTTDKDTKKQKFGGYMKKNIILIAIILVAITNISAQMRNHATVEIIFSVPEITNLQINDATLMFHLNYDPNSSSLYESRNLTSTYNIQSTGTNKRIMAKLENNMPQNTFLELRADPPSGAASVGYVTLNAMPQQIVTGISNVNADNLLLNFRLRADIGAPVATNQRNRVTLTIQD